MSDEFVKWLGAGVVTTGVLLACGTGVAAAETDSGSDDGGTTSSQSADTDAETAGPAATDSDVDLDEPVTDADLDEPDTSPAENDTVDAASDDETEEIGTPVEEEDLTGAQPTTEAPVEGSDTAADERRDETEQTVDDTSVRAFSTVSRSTDIDPPTEDPPLDAPVTPAAAVIPSAPPTPTGPVASVFELPAAQPTAAVQAPPPPPVRSPIELLGGIVLNLITATAQLLNPAPVTPPPSTVPAGRTAQAGGELAAPLLPGVTNGVTGVQVGRSRLAIPGAFIGDSVAADWYFPTQADGTVDAQGVVWMQHGFGANNTFYSALAKELAMETNSIVVAPNLSSIPFTFSGGCLNCASSQQAASAAFLDPDRTALIDSAQAAGYTGSADALTGKFVLAGHSAGGGFATAVASDYLNDGTDAQDAELVGVVMFDGVSNGAMDGSFAKQVDVLEAAGTPIYQIAAPAQAWNAFGATTNALLGAMPGQFTGVVLAGGSHVDSMLGVNPLFDVVLQLVTGRVPAGNTAAVYTLSTGWINDMYVGATPLAPQYGFYAAANQQIIMGPTAALVLPSPVANQLSFGDRILTGVIDAVGEQEDNLLGVVMFDGVSRAPLFTDSLAALDAAQIPDYQISAPPQQWNAWDVTTELMVATYQDRFNGLQMVNGSHTDVIAGNSLFAQLAEVLSAIVVRPSPPGAKAAVRTLATGWVNDIYAGNTTYATNPAEPFYGVYGPDGGGPQDYDGGNRDVVMGEATASTLPSPPVTVDPSLPPTEN